VDVTHALLLPDVVPPSDGLLKNLCLYWDGVRTATPTGTASALTLRYPESATYRALRDEFGVISEYAIRVDFEDLVPPAPGQELPPPDSRAYVSLDRDERGRPVFGHRIHVPNADPTADTADDPGAPETWMTPEIASALIATQADLVIRRLREARVIARRQALAPLAYSLAGHMASLAGPSDDSAAVAEAALVTAVVQGFEIDGRTPLDTIIRFREKNWRGMARLRAALIDLSAALDEGLAIDAAMASARNVVRNRVEPALGALETILKENNVVFALKAALGASAIIASSAPLPAALTHGRELAAQTVRYRFSKASVEEQHPFGYLHRLSQFFPPPERAHSQGGETASLLALELRDVLLDLLPALQTTIREAAQRRVVDVVGEADR
jgi:hypothetical protein